MKDFVDSLIHLSFIDRSTTLGKVVDWLAKHELIIFLLAFQFLLRIPNLFEPYWYGDEGIYLTIGNALRDGQLLYADIIDHKTPLIYYMAMFPSQLWFRVFFLGWMAMATTSFFYITKHFHFSRFQSLLSTLVFIVLTTLPWLEGNIPNGELFVIGFVLVALWLSVRTKFITNLLDRSKINLKLSKNNLKLIFVTGILLGLAILTKVPALFDAVGIGAIGLLLWTKPKLTVSLRLRRTLQFWTLLGVGILIPILLSILYFAARGTLPDYFNFGLLYNFKYAGSWELTTNPAWLKFFFSMKGKLLVLLSIWGATLICSQKLRPRVQFLLFWSSSAIFASMLSSRPYPHYLLQLVPPIILLTTTVLLTKKLLQRKTEVLLTLVVLGIVAVAIKTLAFGFYPTVKYYQAFNNLMTQKISEEEYRNSFDHLMKDNYQIAELLKQAQAKQIFIWGTNPTLYALSQTYPVGRFTVSFHIKDFPEGFEQTASALLANKPEYIIVMKNESADFPALYQLLTNEYIAVKEFDHQTVFKRTLFTQ